MRSPGKMKGIQGYMNVELNTDGHSESVHNGNAFRTVIDTTTTQLKTGERPRLEVHP